MPRRRHDSLSKDLLSRWYEPFGPIASPQRVHGEERQIDVVLTVEHDAPALQEYRQHLGILGHLARGILAIEPFRNPCTEIELRDCIVKAIELYDERLRRARRKGTPTRAVTVPELLVITPTSSADLLERAGARPSNELPEGFFRLPELFATTLAVVARLPKTQETLWLRLLGRGEVQQDAIAELSNLPDEHPLRSLTIRRVLRWRKEAEQRPTLSPAERELIMNTERWVNQWEQRLLRKGRIEGKAEGKAEGRAEVLRLAILDLCELLEIAVSPENRARLEAMDADELETQRLTIKQTKRWPLDAGRGCTANSKEEHAIDQRDPNVP